MTMTLELTEQQVNYIAFALAQRPYGEVVELVQVIQMQAAKQSGQARPQPVEGHVQADT